MDQFKTPTAKRMRSKLESNPECQTPIKIPATPYLKQIGYGCGVNVFTLERSPRVGFSRSPWAIKKRNTKLTKDQKYDARIQLEANVLRNLKHPNIVGFRALTMTDTGVPCLAMEQLDKSLGDMIEERVDAGQYSFSAKHIENVAFEVAKGLEYLHHDVHILHGDLKSYNILASSDLKTIKICDFGVCVPLNDSLMLDEAQGKFEYVGTACWNAPEVVSEEGPITNKADMWAYGLILWEMIALSSPHVEESFSESALNDSMMNHLAESSDLDGSLLDDSLNCKYGTRPPLPAIEIGPEYGKVLEIFFLCTDRDIKTRPSAKGVVMYFNNYIQAQKKSEMDCE